MRLSSLAVAGLCSVLALVNLGLAAPPADALSIRNDDQVRWGAPVRVRRAHTRIHVSALTRVTPIDAVALTPRGACPYPAAGTMPQWSLFPCTEFAAPTPRYVTQHREIAWAGVHFFPQYVGASTVAVAERVPHKIVLRTKY